MSVILPKTSPMPRKNKGFTLLELLIATGVFSIVLLVITVGVIRFANAYYQGNTRVETQTTARAIMQEIARSIELSSTVYTDLNTSPTSNIKGFCVDNQLYSYVVGRQVTDNGAFSSNQGYHGFFSSALAGQCSAATSPVSPWPSGASFPATVISGRELLGNHMRIAALDITPNGNLYTIRLRVIYGDDDLLLPAVTGTTDWSKESCSGSIPGSQFCAVSDLTTTVQKRF